MTEPHRIPDHVVAMIPSYLARQRWYAGKEPPPADAVAVIDADDLISMTDGTHRLMWAVIDVEGARYQLMIGERPMGEIAEFLNGHEDAVLGADEHAYYYDGTLDSELALALLVLVTEGSEKAEMVRPVGVEQSNTSLVYDERLILKLFRRLPEGRNPDVEVTEALDRVGFNHMPAPIAIWRRHDLDLIMVQEYLAGGSEGWALALTSLRDLYASGPDDPGEAGGDFASEARRLGQMTGRMHLALGEAFGVDRAEFRSVGWPRVLNAIETGLRAVVGAAWPGSAAELMDRLQAVSHPGPAIRVHGDYHLSQVMRSDIGWFVLDFEGEPARTLDERTANTSPLKDLTGMLRSFQYAAHYVLLEREDHELERLQPLAEAWEARNREAFVGGYLDVTGIDALLPEGGETRQAVSLAFELDKALYELSYERLYRPDWVSIPAGAIARLLEGWRSFLGG